MGFVNTNGHQVHISNIGSGTISNWSAGTITTSGGSYSLYTIIQPSITSYHILGEDVEVEGYKDSYISLIIATINVLGKQYYDELKEQQVNLPKEIVDFLEKKFVILERDRKIDSVINDRGNEK